MKQYSPLIIPEDSSWGKFTIRRYMPIWLKTFIDGVFNIIRWIPVIYRDNDWDSTYILDILKYKLINQRAYLIKHNRHLGIPETNRDITICLNLIERLREDFYEMEYTDYKVSNFEFIPSLEHPDCVEVNCDIISDNLMDYINKYKIQLKKVLISNPHLSLDTPEGRLGVAIRISRLNHDKCKKLLFNILDRKIEYWWD
jgi:hypothetical protein